MRSLAVSLSLLSVCVSAIRAPAAITISFDQTEATVSASGVGYDDQILYNTGGTTVTATETPYFSQTISAFPTIGNTALFTGSFNQFRGGTLYDYTLGYFIVYFLPDTNVSYSASGNYSITGGYTQLHSALRDLGTGQYLYDNNQLTSGAPASFALGGPPGNVGYPFSGSLAGTLLAGHTYQWWVIGDAQAYPVDDFGATASAISR
jgi:hypothetical protein